MAEDTFLEDALLRQLISVGEVDILVGLACHDNADEVRQAITAIEQSVQQNFIRQRVVIVRIQSGPDYQEDPNELSPNGAEPKSKRLQGLTSLRTIHRVTASFPRTPSPGLALRTIISSADLLRARACAMVSPATHLTPDWISRLLRPAYYDKFDFVAPVYARHKFEGLLARSLLYPMSRAVFGLRIREIYSDEWAFSDRLATFSLEQDVWHEEAVRSRPEAWMAVSALASDFRCAQSFLGEKPGGAGADLVEVMRQTVGSLFWCLEKYQTFWLGREGSQPVPTFGPERHILTEPVDMNLQRIFEMFCTGVAELEPLLRSILDLETHARIKDLAAASDISFRFPPELWVRTLYDFASSYHLGVMNRDHLVQALVPLYRGMIYSFLVEHANSSPQEIEQAGESLCLEFERHKSYLRERWNAEVEVKS